MRINKLFKFLVWFSLIIALIFASYILWNKYNSTNKTPKYITTKLQIGDIVEQVSANGTLNPVVIVNVGTQISGTVKYLNTDFNQKVKAGQILAKLDPAIFQTEIDKQLANIRQIQANLNLSNSILERNQKLADEGFISPLALQTYKKDVESQKAQLYLAQAQLKKAQIDLSNSIIKSPINGVVISKSIDIGQTVAASFQTPTLFQIAKDLTNMEIYTNVAEADIGKVKIGLPSIFTVDAFPNQIFNGFIKQIRINPTITQNVVTYNVVIGVKNDGNLLPGMTAQVKINTQEKVGVFKLPLMALKFRPIGKQDKQEKINSNSAKSDSKAENKRDFKNRENTQTTQISDLNSTNNASSNNNSNLSTIYLLVKDKENNPILKPVQVRLGLTDQKFIEVISNELHEGDEVVMRNNTRNTNDTNQNSQAKFRLSM